MDLHMSDRIVVVTGASKGIGYACAVAFAAEGTKVALVSRSQANLDAAMARFPRGQHAPIALMADLTQADEAERIVATAERQLGAIDVLVNSAGAARRYAPDPVQRFLILSQPAGADAMPAVPRVQAAQRSGRVRLRTESGLEAGRRVRRRPSAGSSRSCNRTGSS